MNPNFVNNCSLSYKCPMVWEELEGSGNIRSCNKCDKEVYWCNDPVEYYEHAANQDCVAFYTETDFKSNEPPKATLGIPVYKVSFFTRIKRAIEYFLLLTKIKE